jgi:predicted nucleic acid-binding protein
VSLFVDTSIWYAAANSSDANNARAKVILLSGEVLLTTDHVLLETWVLLGYRINRRAAEKFWEALRAGTAIIEPGGAADLAAWQIGAAFRDQDFSIVGRTSLAVIGRLGMDRAASLDDDFAIFRFGPNRRRAFTVLGNRAASAPRGVSVRYPPPHWSTITI